MELDSFNDQMMQFKTMLAEGTIQHAYQGLIAYLSNLKAYLQKKYPDFIVPSHMYQGYLDMTYFSFFPPSIKEHKLKIGIVFVYESFHFEVALFGVNREVQETYWKLIKESGMEKYHITPDPLKTDYIMNHVLVSDPDFDDLDSLTKRIEEGTLAFIKDAEVLLSMFED